GVKELLEGSKISALAMAISEVPSSRNPPAINTLPSGRRVAVWAARAARSTFIFSTGDRQFKYKLAASVMKGADAVGDALFSKDWTSMGRDEGAHLDNNEATRRIDSRKCSLCMVSPVDSTLYTPPS